MTINENTSKIMGELKNMVTSEKNVLDVLEKEIIRLQNENKKLENDIKFLQDKIGSHVNGYFGSQYNKCWGELRKDMSVINIDLVLYDYKQHKVKIIECKPMPQEFDINDVEYDGTVDKHIGQKRVLRALAIISNNINNNISSEFKMDVSILWYDPEEIPNPKYIKVHNLTTGKLFELHGDNIKKYNELHLDESIIKSKNAPIKRNI